MFILFTVFQYEVSLLELVAVVTGLVGVWLATTGVRITWPWWVISSILYGILFLQFKLYSSAALQVVFVLAGIWGWFGWGKEGAKPGKLSNKHRIFWLGSSLFTWILLAPAFAFIGAAASWPDSFILVGSLVAQILMVIQKYEAWPLWFVIDIMGTVHYARQDLWFTSILYFVFTIIAIIGWRNWLLKSKQLR
jgi:nicotinamide mononucleotide transporter